MMPPCAGALELAHARLSARYGALPDEALWARLGSVRDHAMLLDALRASVLVRWVRGVLINHGAHAIETELRTAWRDEVRQVASWMPADWQEGVLWWSTWPDLPLLQHIARGAAVPAWLVGDPAYREGVGAAAPELSRWRAARQIVASDGSGAQAWIASWRNRCPEHDAPGLVAVARLLLAACTVASGIASSKAAIHGRRRALTILYRRTMLEPAAAFCYLAIVTIDLERLRGELVRSALFGRQRGPA